MKFIKSEKAKRLVPAQWSSQATIGQILFHLFQTRVYHFHLCRSLVTDLRSAEKFDISHLSSPSVAPLVEAAKVFYVEGYFLTHGTDCVLTLSQKSAAVGKVHLSVLCLF